MAPAKIADRLASRRMELGSALLALVLSPGVAALMLAGGPIHLRGSNALAFFDSVFLGPVLALVGAWLDVRRGQPLGLLALGLGVLLTLDGVFATYLLALPLLLLVLLSFASAIVRRRAGGRPPGPHDPSPPNR